MSSSEISVSEIEGVRIFEIACSADNRGTFLKYEDFNQLSDPLGSVAISINPIAGTIRGLHFQTFPFAEEKIISCLQGSIYEVFVDLRPNSSSFGKFATIQLSDQNFNQVYLPKGIAHGFQTLLPDTILHYFLTSQYSLLHANVLNPFENLNIKWPIKNALISERDKEGMSFENAAQKYAQSLLDFQ